MKSLLLDISKLAKYQRLINSYQLHRCLINVDVRLPPSVTCSDRGKGVVSSKCFKIDKIPIPYFYGLLQKKNAVY